MTLPTVNFINQSGDKLFMEPQSEKQNRVKRFIKETVRVIRITKKPNKDEFLSLVKVTGLGIILIGLIGFILHIIKQLL